MKIITDCFNKKLSKSIHFEGNDKKTNEKVPGKEQKTVPNSKITGIVSFVTKT